jgi:hypothetical protein
MTVPSFVRVGRTQTGYRLRVEGRGTLRESPAVHEFAGRALQDEASTLVVDLSDCDYIDSTFLGGLVILHRRYGCGPTPRLSLAASPALWSRVIAPNHLDRLFRFVEQSPEVLGADETIPLLSLKPGDLGWHVMECHRRLAETGGPNQAAYDQVADELARDLAASRARQK